MIESSENKQLKLYVYNFDLDTVREVLLTPNSAWGGEGSLGCGIGYGYLHRIPIRDDKIKATDAKPIDNKQNTNILIQNSAIIGQTSALNNQLTTNLVNLNLNNQVAQIVTNNQQENVPLLPTNNLYPFDLSKIKAPQLEKVEQTNQIINLQQSDNSAQQPLLPPIVSSSQQQKPPQIQLSNFQLPTNFLTTNNPTENTILPNFQFMNLATSQVNPSTVNTNMQPPFTNFFQPQLSPPSANPTTNSNQMVQSLVQQTISNHLLQQQQQHDLVQPSFSTIFDPYRVAAAATQDHGNSHDHTAHGHSHDH